MTGLDAETLLDEYGQTKCGACQRTVVPYTIGRVSYCPVCRYTWNVTCIAMNVREIPELREFHRLVILDELREKFGV